MPVEFELEFNVQTSTRAGYRSFIQRMRARLGVRFSHNRPALAVQVEPPTRFFELILRTADHAVRFRLRMDNLYLIGYQMENGEWWEFDNNNNTRLIPASNFLGLSVNYAGLAAAAAEPNQSLTMEDMRVGYYNIGYAVNQLATSPRTRTRARCLIVVVMMFCESARLIPVFEYMATNFNNRYGTSSADYNAGNRDTEGQIQPWITVLVRSWGHLSSALLRADAYPEERFQLRRNDVRLPPDNREIRTIAQATEILGILLGLCFIRSGPRRFPRMADDDDDKGLCLLGSPLVEVFSVRIDNIDNKDPGDLYGTITVIDGLNTEFIYNRTSDNPESIKPGQNATLDGPCYTISALGNFSINLLLTDKDASSRHNEIVNHNISWDSHITGNKYDEPICQKIEGKNGAVTVNYAVLKNAVGARITIKIVEGGESPVEVYGHVSANYASWDNPNTTSLLFNRESNDCVVVRRWRNVPLSRWMVAVPLDNSLKITATLSDADTFSGDDLIANGTVEFPAQLYGTSVKTISGEDGNYVDVVVHWTLDI